MITLVVFYEFDSLVALAGDYEKLLGSCLNQAYIPVAV